MIQKNIETSLLHYLAVMSNQLTTGGLQVTGSFDTGALATEATLEKLINGIWTYVPNTSMEYTFYAGSEPNNPSGSTDNIKTIAYKEGGVTVLTRMFTWDNAGGSDGSDRIVSITAS